VACESGEGSLKRLRLELRTNKSQREYDSPVSGARPFLARVPRPRGHHPHPELARYSRRMFVAVAALIRCHVIARQQNAAEERQEERSTAAARISASSAKAGGQA
jgi:hypothetical protein